MKKEKIKQQRNEGTKRATARIVSLAPSKAEVRGISIALLCFLVPLLLNAATVLIPLQTCGISPAADHSITLTPLQALGSNSIPVMDKIQGTTDANGNWSPTLLQGVYQADVRPVNGAVGVTEFYFYVDPSNAVQNAPANLLTGTNNTWPPNQYAYSASASDERYAPAGSAGNGNPNAVTNNQTGVIFTNLAIYGSATLNNAPVVTNSEPVTVSSNAIGLGYNVFTNGYMTAAGFVAATSAGAALQGELNYQASGATAFFGSGNGTFSTNFVGGKISAASGFYYLPQGFVFSNQWCSASWIIEGVGEMKTIFSGDSNVLKTTVGNSVPGPFRFEIRNVGFVWSNWWSKAIGVDLQGAGAMDSVHDCYFGDYSAYTNGVGGGIPTLFLTPGYSSGIIPLVMSGEWGNQVCRDCFFTASATGPVFPAPHTRIENLEIDGVGEGELPAGGGLIQTNQYATNDLTQLAGGESSPLLDCYVSMGPAMVLLGNGDVYVRDIKVGSSGVGLLAVTSLGFGETKVETFHAEEYKNKFVHADLVVPNTSNPSYTILPTQIWCENWGGQDPQYAGLLNAYCFDTANFTFTPLSTPDANGFTPYTQELSTGLSPEDQTGTTPMLFYRVNCKPLLTIDSGQTNTMVAAWNGLTIFSTNSWNLNFTNGMSGVVFFSVVSNQAPMLGKYSNGVMYGYIPPMGKF